MLFASLPLAVLAQPLDQRPLKDDSFAPAPAGSATPPDEHVLPMPRDNSVTTAPAPAYDPSAAAPPDNSVTTAPLGPPTDNSTDSSEQEMVPNPLDNPNAPSGPGTSKLAQPQGQPRHGGWVQMGTATLQALDKVNAIETTLAVKVGETGHFGSLDIGVRGCFVRTPDQPADATAFLVIRDHRADAPAFTGWMVRSAPYMSMLAHPIYDVRVAGCAP
jgi:hypothetical protein